MSQRPELGLAHRSTQQALLNECGYGRTSCLLPAEEKPAEPLGEDVEELEPLYTAGEEVKWCSHCGNQYAGSSKIKTRIAVFPNSSSLSVHPKESEAGS